MIAGVAEFLSPTAVPVFTTVNLWMSVAFELIILILLVLFLWLRGWTPATVGLQPSTSGTLIGLGIGAGLLCGTTALTWLAGQVFDLSDYEAFYMRLVGPDASLASIVAVSVVNPLYEELFLCGYVITALRRHGSVALAVNVSMLIRLTCHLYQGPLGVATVIACGLVFSWWYVRIGRLWPLLAAHAVLDFFPLISYW